MQFKARKPLKKRPGLLKKAKKAVGASVTVKAKKDIEIDVEDEKTLDFMNDSANMETETETGKENEASMLLEEEEEEDDDVTPAAKSGDMEVEEEVDMEDKKKDVEYKKRRLEGFKKTLASQFERNTAAADKNYGGKTTRAKAFPIHPNCNEMDLYQLLESVAKPKSILIEKAPMKLVLDGVDSRKALIAMFDFENESDCKKAVEYLHKRKVHELELIAQYQRPKRQLTDEEAENSFANKSHWVYVSNIDSSINEQDLYNFINSKVSNLNDFSPNKECILLKHHLTDSSKPGIAYIHLENNSDARNVVNALHLQNIDNGRLFARLTRNRVPFERSENLRGTAKSICIDNIHYTVTNEELTEFAKKFVSNITNDWIVEAKVWVDNRGYPRGMASIDFDSIEHANAAFDELNGKHLKGLTVTVGFRNKDAMKKPVKFNKKLQKQKKQQEKQQQKQKQGKQGKQGKQQGKQKETKQNENKAKQLKESGLNVKKEKTNENKNAKVSDEIKGKLNNNKSQSKIGKVLSRDNRGRGRGRGGNRGGNRGRGASRGGNNGGHRGGNRGGFNSRGRGGFRGRGRGGNRGGSRGRGGRGNSRGRGRGRN